MVVEVAPRYGDVSRIVLGINESVITVFTAMSLMFGYFEGGNLTEEYAMPFIAISLFIFIDYFLNGTISRIRLICGSIVLTYKGR